MRLLGHQPHVHVPSRQVYCAAAVPPAVEYIAMDQRAMQVLLMVRVQMPTSRAGRKALLSLLSSFDVRFVMLPATCETNPASAGLSVDNTFGHMADALQCFWYSTTAAGNKQHYRCSEHVSSV